ncbi:MAG TPA: GDSL-type esterase/lipase family protein [Gillisia sp.]|nr:GDSL-type esterase/lipase family protein [Gillisia sp.]
MKFIFTFLLASSALLAQETTPLDSSYANGYYVERLAFFELLPNRVNEIVFMGNSITEVGDWQEIILQPNVVNRGISGDNSYGVFHRLDEVLVSNPMKLFIMIGVNDIKRGTPISKILMNYERIAGKVKKEAPETLLYFQSVLPVTEPILATIYNQINNEKIRTLNEGIKAIAKKYNLVYIDLHNEVFLDSKGQLKRELTTDGLHLKPASYFLWIDYLQKHLYL